MFESEQKDYPTAFFKGLLLECFIREDQNIRLKITGLEFLHNIFKEMQNEKRISIINDVVESIKTGKFDGWYIDIYSPVPDQIISKFPLFHDIILSYNSFNSQILG